jgi:hypothetical protein
VIINYPTDFGGSRKSYRYLDAARCSSLLKHRKRRSIESSGLSRSVVPEGLGAQPPEPSGGNMLNTGRGFMARSAAATASRLSQSTLEGP